MPPQRVRVMGAVRSHPDCAGPGLTPATGQVIAQPRMAPALVATIGVPGAPVVTVAVPSAPVVAVAVPYVMLAPTAGVAAPLVETLLTLITSGCPAAGMPMGDALQASVPSAGLVMRSADSLPVPQYQSATAPAGMRRALAPDMLATPFRRKFQPLVPLEPILPIDETYTALKDG